MTLTPLQLQSSSEEPALPVATGRLRRGWLAVKGWCVRQWSAIRPGPEARRGAVAATVATAALCVLWAGLYLHSGFGYAVDFAFVIICAALLMSLTALIVALGLTIARKLPRLASGLIVGACGVVLLLWLPLPLGIAAAVAVGLAEGFLGATIATFRAPAFGRATRRKKVITYSIFALSVSANVYFGWLLVHDGSNAKLVAWKPPIDAMPPGLSVANPAEAGPHRVQTLCYGAGTDIRRPEYGAAVAIQSGTVDASELLDDLKGWKRWVRRLYWGFDIDKLPLNARVWYPEGPGPFPLILIVHGNHEMSDFSDPGYAYLGQLLASRGFIFASVDENFLNSGLFHDPPKQQAARGWMLLEHLKLWRQWNQKAGNPFFGKVDMSRISLMGHSRGGEAVATAVLFNRMKYYPENGNIRFDYGFDIQSIVAIAPADGQYKPAGQQRTIEDVSYLTLQGAHDADVSSFMGSRQWDHVRFTKPGSWFKAELYAYRANHGQFNSVWGRMDLDRPLGWLLNLRPLLSGEEQRRIAKTYISAFVEATLHGRREYLPLFADWRVARDWLPDTLYLDRYQDASYIALAGFQEDADLATTTAPGGRSEGQGLSIWREGRIPWRSDDREYNGLFVGWNREPGAPAARYSVTLPAGAAARWPLTTDSTVELSLAALDEDAPLPGHRKDEPDKRPQASSQHEREALELTIELVLADGTVATAVSSRFAALPPPLKEQFTKLAPMEEQAYEKDWEPIFQTVRVPFAAFAAAGGAGAFDPRQVTAVRLTFDRTAMSVLCVGGIGFGRTRPPAGALHSAAPSR